MAKTFRLLLLPSILLVFLTIPPAKPQNIRGDLSRPSRRHAEQMAQMMIEARRLGLTAEDKHGYWLDSLIAAKAAATTTEAGRGAANGKNTNAADHGTKAELTFPPSAEDGDQKVHVEARRG